jgi:hypothetical protein
MMIIFQASPGASTMSMLLVALFCRREEVEAYYDLNQEIAQLSSRVQVGQTFVGSRS